MRAKQTEHGTKLWLSASDTYDWAHRIGNSWPCSFYAGQRLFAEFDCNGDLVDIAVNGRLEEDGDGNEFNAITSDFLRERFGPNHPAIRD